VVPNLPLSVLQGGARGVRGADRGGPGALCRPAYLRARGWVSLRLDRPDVDWDEVAELAIDAYRLTARSSSLRGV
jgi:hypothetical protein